MKKYIPLFFLLFPMLAILAWVAQLNLIRSTGTKIRLPIAGYDPRDLLAGHFLQYRIEYGLEQQCGNLNYNSQNRNVETCLCLKPTANSLYQGDYFTDCESARRCPTYLAGSCEYGRFTADIERYYFPEEYAEKLRIVPPESVLEVSLNSDGRAVVNQIYVGKQNILDYVNSK